MFGFGPDPLKYAQNRTKLILIFIMNGLLLLLFTIWDQDSGNDVKFRLNLIKKNYLKFLKIATKSH